MSSAHAATIIWNGSAGDGIYQTGANWDGGVPPANNDFQDFASFGSAATAGTVTLSSGRDVRGIIFDTPGWTISGSSFNDIRTVTSSGAGTNTFTNTLNLLGSNTWTVAGGSSLYMAGGSGSLYLRNNFLTLTGGGSMIVENPIGGFGSGTWGINLGNAELQLNNTTIFTGGASTGSAIFITDQNSILRLQATTAQADSLIAGGRIVDQLGLGLSVTDIGGGFAQVVPLPEPSAGALLLGTLTLAALGARRH